MKPPRIIKHLQRGQANTEYIVIVGALVAALIVNVPGTKQTAIEHLVSIIKRNYTGYSYGLSVAELPDKNEADNSN